MTLVERLERLYAEDPDHHGACGYCHAAAPPHDELCVWQTTREAITRLRALEALLAARPRDRRP